MQILRCWLETNALFEIDIVFSCSILFSWGKRTLHSAVLLSVKKVLDAAPAVLYQDTSFLISLTKLFAKTVIFYL